MAVGDSSLKVLAPLRDRRGGLAAFFAASAPLSTGGPSRPGRLQGEGPLEAPDGQGSELHELYPVFFVIVVVIVLFL